MSGKKSVSVMKHWIVESMLEPQPLLLGHMIEAIVIAEKIAVAGCGFRKIVPLAIKTESHRSDTPRHDRTRRRPTETDRDIGIPARQADGAAVADRTLGLKWPATLDFFTPNPDIGHEFDTESSNT